LRISLISLLLAPMLLAISLRINNRAIVPPTKAGTSDDARKDWICTGGGIGVAGSGVSWCQNWLLSFWLTLLEGW
jgi:hypothetical protein